MGRGPVLAARVMDPNGALSAEDLAAVERCLAEFERALPQMFFLVYLGSLPPRIPAAAFGFWLLNQAAVPELDPWRANERGMLLTVDTGRGAAALSAGYFIENHLSQRDLDSALRAGGKELAAEDYPAAVERVTGALIRLFSSRARALAKAGAAPPLPPEPLPETPSDFQPLPRLDEPDLITPEPEEASVEVSPAWEPSEVPTVDEELCEIPPPEAAEVVEENTDTNPVSDSTTEAEEPEAEDAPAKTGRSGKKRKREVSADPGPEPQIQEETGSTDPSARRPETEPDSVTGQVKKRAKAKNRQSRHRRG